MKNVFFYFKKKIDLLVYRNLEDKLVFVGFNRYMVDVRKVCVIVFVLVFCEVCMIYCWFNKNWSILYIYGSKKYCD